MFRHGPRGPPPSRRPRS